MYTLIEIITLVGLG